MKGVKMSRNTEGYFSADYSISMVEVKAENREQVEALLQQFTDIIAKVMDDKVCWDEADWTIEENIFDSVKGEWVTK